LIRLREEVRKMPTITLPGLGQGRRRATDDARKATSDLGLPAIDWSKLDPSKIDLSKIDLSKLDLPDRAEISKQLRKASKEQFKRASKELNNALPRRGPSPWPIAILGVIGGLVIGWFLATSPSARSTIERGFGGARRGVSGMVAGMTSQATAEPWERETQSPMSSDTYAAAIGAQRGVTRETPVGVGPGRTTDEVTPGG
jgi:hypothetical protein